MFCSDDFQKRDVTTEGLELAAKWKIPYFETSAKTGENVSLPFEYIMHAQLAIKDPKKSKGKKL